MNTYDLDLACVAAGMVTSVGHDARTACASLRAGISRPQPLHEWSSPSLTAPELVPLRGHPVVPITNGFLGVARWLQLCRVALADLAAQLEASAAATLLLLWLPELDDPRFEDDPRTREHALQDTLVSPLLAMVPQLGPLVGTATRPLGRQGLAQILVEAQAWLCNGIERIVVLAVDSYVDPLSLEWFAQLGRLKHDSNPVGLSPGEAAVALCLTLGDRASPRCARVFHAADTQPNLDDAASAHALGEVLSALVETGDQWLLSDLNGEELRARALGVAMTALSPARAAGLRTTHIAAEIGDTGEVSALLNLAFAASRQHARGSKDRAMILAHAELGGVSGASLVGGRA